MVIGNLILCYQMVYYQMTIQNVDTYTSCSGEKVNGCTGASLATLSRYSDRAAVCLDKEPALRVRL